MTTPNFFPQPNTTEIVRSLSLINCIRDAMLEKNGIITFAEFMSLALYHPQYGYYNSPDFALGKSGDFTTAPEISPLFAKCLARQCAQILEDVSFADILELGAGSGKLACDLLIELEHLEKLPIHYYIYEISPVLRTKQQDFLQRHCPQLISRIIWLEKLPEHFNGIVIANEVLDALPVNRFRIDGGEIKECGVSWNGQLFNWQVMPPSSKLQTVAKLLHLELALQDQYESEIHLALRDYIATLATMLQRGVMLFIDYGYGQREYYHPERTQGTLTCFYKHHRHADPFAFPGLQDITAHVNFTSVIDVAHDYGCDLLGFTTQAAFLFSCGLMDLASIEEKNIGANAKEEFALHQAIKLLTLPTEMGEVIKVMALGKQINFPLLGFSHQDRRRDL